MTELSDILKRIENEAGFSLYVHACGRHDLDDKNPPSSENYVRAVHKMDPRGLHAHILPPGIKFLLINASVYGPTSQTEVVTYGELGAEKKITKLVKEHGLIIKEKRGFLGFKTKKEEFGEITVMKEMTIYQGSQKLSEIIETNSPETAHYVGLSIKKDIEDDVGRTNDPRLTIFGNERLIKDIVAYLKNKPKNYLEFIKSVLPREKYPNVNKGILDEAIIHDSRYRPITSIIFHEIKISDLGKHLNNYNNVDDYVKSRNATLIKIN